MKPEESVGCHQILTTLGHETNSDDEQRLRELVEHVIILIDHDRAKRYHKMAIGKEIQKFANC